jgi:hypothetical protein
MNSVQTLKDYYNRSDCNRYRTLTLSLTINSIQTLKDYYQETIIHAAMAGADAFYYFNPWNVLVYGTHATMDDHTTLSTTLSELDSVLGCATRVWVTTAALSSSISRWNDTFTLTGSRIGAAGAGGAQTTVWRFTPAGMRAGAGAGHGARV